MFKNLASSLFLSERDSEVNERGEPYPSYLPDNNPKVKGRVITTIHKAKEIRPFVEKCITIAKRSIEAEAEAQQYATSAERGSEEWKSWRNSDQWVKWNQAILPSVNARRRAIQLLGNKYAVSILFSQIAPRFVDRNGGYTRILRLATPRLGDAGIRAALEFVGENDRVKQSSVKPAFDSEDSTEAVAEADEAEVTTEEATTEESVEESNDSPDADAGDAKEEE